jgi:hypothetical protein
MAEDQTVKSEDQVLMDPLEIKIEKKFVTGLALMSEYEFSTNIEARKEFEKDAARPVKLTVPNGTKSVYVAIKGVGMWFGKEELLAAPISTFRYEVQEGQLNGNEFRFVIRGIFSDRLATLPWGANFRVEVLCFG